MDMFMMKVKRNQEEVCFGIHTKKEKKTLKRLLDEENHG